MLQMDDQRGDGHFDEACRFLVTLGVAAHGYGSTSVQLEAYLRRLIRAFGYHGAFRSTPTEIYFAFQLEEGGWQRTHLATMPGTGLALDRLARVGSLVDAVETGGVSLADAPGRLEGIAESRAPFGTAASALSYAGVGAAFGVLLAGTWWDVLFSGLFSLVVYGMVLLSGRYGARTAEWLPFSSAFVAALLAAGARLAVAEVNVVLVTLAAILVLIPGFSISVGVFELVSRHVVSGSANLMNGLVYLSKQFAGAWLGVGLAGLLVSFPPAIAGTPVASSWLWVFVPLLILGLCVIFQTPWRDLLWACLGSTVAYLGVLLGGALAGGNLGNLLGTILAVAYANVWAGRTRRPTSLVLLPAIILLVSGSIGFRGLASLATGQTAIGTEQFLQMFVVALTIAAGLLVGNTLLRPKATL